MPLAGPALTELDPTADLLDYGLKSKPDDLAMVSTKTQMSWRELAEVSTRLAVQYLDRQTGTAMVLVQVNRTDRKS